MGVSRWIKQSWNSTEPKPWLKWLARALWLGTVIALLCAAITIWVIARSDLPGFAELENPKYDLASIIYDAEGEPFGKYYIENREFIDYKDLSPHLVNALLSVEDARFYSHAGVDFWALLRVGFKTVLLRQESSGGGSTISQQLAKLLFNRESLRGKNKLQRALTLLKIKIKEWITAVRLERSYTKEEIMAMYLNKFEFINGAHGIQSAAQIYFAKDQSELKIEEAAVLVGMLKNPAYYNPIRFTDRTRDRRNIVLSLMNRNDHLTKATRDTLIARPLDITAFDRKSQSEGLAPYFRAELTKWLKELLLQPQYYNSDDNQPYDIFRDGLNIYTTIDARYQKHAEDAVFAHLTTLQKRYWRRWQNMDPIRYEANDTQIELREESIQRRIRDTDIYKNGYQKYFQELNKKSQDQFGLDLKEPTIRRLMADPAYVQTIDAAIRPSFQQLTRSQLWQEIKSQWKTFEQYVDDMMNEEIDATVFAYTDTLTKVERMTRLDSLLYHLRHLQAGLLSLDPKTGEIKAWVGGPSHSYFKFDHVTVRRQVGSTIKPFVYATAIAVQGISPCQEYRDIQYTIAPGDANFHVDAEWSPSNASGAFTQNKYNLYQGLLYSKNSITIRLVQELGTIEPIRDLLHNVGIDKYERINDGRYVVPEVPSLSLGSVDLSLIEMAGAYTTFPNDGIYTEPTFIRRIEDKNGKVIYQSSPIQRRAINSLYNAVMLDMLKNNVGEGFKLGIKSKAGGKTGTTNDYADGWFMGFTPDLVTGIWVGGDEKWVRFYTLENGQGFVMARPLFADYMKRVEKDEEINFNTSAKFPKSPPGLDALIDCSRYKQEDPDKERDLRLEEKVDLDEFDEIELEDEFDDFGEFEEMEVDTLRW